MIELVLRAPQALVETVSDALADELDALSVSVQDADAGTDGEQALFGERGLPAPAPGWERSTKVPLIIAAPKNHFENLAPVGSRCDQPVGLIDLFPTLTDLCGVKPPAGLDGESLAPLLRNPAMITNRNIVTTFNPGNF